MGMVWRVAAEEKLMDEALGLANRISGYPARAVLDLKQSIHQCCFGDMENALQRETDGIKKAVVRPYNLEID